MKQIEPIFNQEFEAWNIHLPLPDIGQRKFGHIDKAGWSIKYLFGKNEEGEYLDYYASHRMTDDRHVRIYDSGKTINLPTLGSMRLVSQDPEEDARLEKEFYLKNQRISAMLEEKGFGLSGYGPSGIQINHFLKTNKVPQKKQNGNNNKFSTLKNNRSLWRSITLQLAFPIRVGSFIYRPHRD